MTKKLCDLLAHWLVTKWPAMANRFVTPGLDNARKFKQIENYKTQKKL